MSKCKVIAMCNQKGGVTKTTTTANLGIGLAMQGKKVLLVDNDPQADLTTILGWHDSDNLPMTLTNIMEKIVTNKDYDPYGAILRHEEGVDLMPSDIEMAGLEMQLIISMSREYVLKNWINQVKHDYNYIIINCPPSLSMLTINALAASDSVIVPVQAQYLSAKGMTQLMRTIGRVRKEINPALKVEGVVITLADMQTNFAKNTAQTIREQYGSVLKIYKTHIPIATKAAETSAIGESVFKHDKNGTVAEAYRNFTKEVMKGEERNKTQSAKCR